MEFESAQENLAALNTCSSEFFPSLFPGLREMNGENTVSPDSHQHEDYVDMEPLPTGVLPFLSRAELLSDAKNTEGRSCWGWRPPPTQSRLFARCASRSKEMREVLRDIADSGPPMANTMAPHCISQRNNTSEAISSRNYSAAEEVRASLGSRRRKRSYDCMMASVGVRISFLGTGSASPSKHRSGSAILIRGTHLQTDFAILLDVGESCVTQVFHLCAGDVLRFQQLLAALDVVVISHHHADHSCGLPMLLEMLHLAVLSGYRSRDKTLFVLVGTGLQVYYEYLSSVTGLHSLVKFVNLIDTLPLSCLSPDLQNFYLHSKFVKSIIGVPVHHCREAMGFLITLSDELKIVYSGDCRPSHKLISLGQGCDLLIHEATFDDELLAHAERKRHSTVSEAILVAKKMNAKCLVLTHFSQRYPKVPSIIQGMGTFVTAVDLLTFQFPAQFHDVCRLSSDLASVYERLEAFKVNDTSLGNG